MTDNIYRRTPHWIEPPLMVVDTSDEENDQFDDPECTICIQEITHGGIETPCGHHFHQFCIHRVCLTSNRCPNCRNILTEQWMETNDFGDVISAETYWKYVEAEFDEAPLIGPLVPHQQRKFNKLMYGEAYPTPWSQEWINDRLAELRMRFNVSSQYILNESDLEKCEINGRCGIFPEWMEQNA